MITHEVNKQYQVLSREERETVLSWDALSQCWHLYTDEPKHARKYERYIDNDKPTRRGYSVNGGKLAMLEGDLKGVSVQVRKKTILTPEQREASKQKLAKARSARSND